MMKVQLLFYEGTATKSTMPGTTTVNDDYYLQSYLNFNNIKNKVLSVSIQA